MITELTALRQILRLEGLVQWPKSNEAQDELAKALAAAAQDERHAQRTIDEWLVASKFAPTPAEIYAVASAIRRTERECPTCEGTGWISRREERNGEQVSIADRCRACEKKPMRDGKAASAGEEV